MSGNASVVAPVEHFVVVNVNDFRVCFSKKTAGNMSLKYGDELKTMDSRRKLYQVLGTDLSKCVYAVPQMGSGARLVGTLDGGKGAIMAENGVPCDTMFTHTKGVFLIFLLGDCVPIIFLHEHVWGIIHAGRQNAAAILPRILRRLENTVRDPQKTMFIIGPAIRESSYMFPTEKREVLSAQLNDPTWHGYISEVDDFYKVDLPGYCKGLILKAGISRIVDYGINTADPRSGYFSHSHKDESGEGRHAVVVGRLVK